MPSEVLQERPVQILMTGDIVGKPGREAVKQLLPDLRAKYELDLVIANGENIAGGVGLTLATAQELFSSGVDVLTTGNHVWAHKEIIPYLEGKLPILRPLNFSPRAPGRGYLVKNQVLVVNLIGRTFMGNADCPFRAVDFLLAELEDKPSVIIVDFHAEATSEKVAMGRYLDGRVSAVLGTHTHIGTIDSCLLPRDTAYVTDVGMVGAKDSVIGEDVESIIHGFLSNMPHRISVAKGQAIFNAMLVRVDEISGKALNIDRIQREVD